MNSLQKVVQRNKAGEKNGIYSVCSAHPFVIEAALKQALNDQSLLLIEATSNQVDQFGGYTGMKPIDFKKFVSELAGKIKFPIENLILGGDHLGPNRWQNIGSDEAMNNADDLIKAYVAAGFTKIHLDCSMSCADDPTPLSDEIVAQRAARLAKIAEETAINVFGSSSLVYVIGTEVPVPGGAAEELEELEVTSPEAAHKTISCHKKAFEKAGIGDCWPRVIGLVVQPGVEFDHTGIIDFEPEKAEKLSEVVNEYEYLVFEAHSTDYQTDCAYKALVAGHFAILKVGPALTFAMREALYNLADIEEQIVTKAHCSNFKSIVEEVMCEKPGYWEKYYQGTEYQKRFSRSYSFSDRIRYYWSEKSIQDAQEKLFTNLSRTGISLPLLSEYLPMQFKAVREGLIKSDPKSLVLYSIQEVLRSYSSACQQNKG